MEEKKSTLGHLRQKFWVINGPSAVKQVIKKCVKCKRYTAENNNQLMGLLPSARVNLTRAFTHTGCDYAGPIRIKSSPGRGERSRKGYIAIFICMATKAIHIEVVTDLTSTAFIAAVRRFMARRGLVTHFYSDNGTNFVGASKILTKDIISEDELINKGEFEDQVLQFMQQERIIWHFNPPIAPHFGGLWEAGVKSIKFHLKRSLGNEILTFEEISTVLAQIEACLNSRPLCQMTEDIEDLNYLTPGHFLIGESLICHPEENYLDFNMNRLTRWQLCSRLHQEIWSRWYSEYLHEQQKRTKWLSKKANFKLNELVLIKEENCPPCRWIMGRIIKVHTGKDDLVRVATLRTKNGQCKRPIGRLIKLISEDNGVEQIKERMASSNQADQQSNQAEVEEPKDSVSHIKLISFKNRQQNQEKQRSRNFQHSVFNVALALLFVFTLVGGQSFHNVTKIDENSGLIFKNRGKMYEIVNSWNILVHFNLTAYSQELKMLETSKKQVKQICKEIERGDYKVEGCKSDLLILESLINDLKISSEVLIPIVSNEAKLRKKRSFVAGIVTGIVGTTIYNKIKNNEVNDMIEKAYSNEEHMLKLIQNQTSVVEGLTQFMKNQTQLVDTQFTQVVHNIDVIKTYMENQEQEISELLVNQKFNDITRQLILIILKVRKNEQKIKDVLLSKNTNEILISDDQFQSEFKKIKPWLPKNQMLPRFKILYEIYKCSRKHIIVNRSSIVMRIEIPLLNTEFMEMIETIPVPAVFNQSIFYIEIKNKMMLHNVKKEQLLKLSQLNLNSNNCDSMNGEDFMCNSMPRISVLQSCEGNVFRNISNGNCRMKEEIGNEFWYKIDGRSWIFSIGTLTEVNLHCHAYEEKLELSGSGILNVAENCHVITEKINLYSEIVSQIEHSHFVIPTIDFKLKLTHKKLEKWEQWNSNNISMKIEKDLEHLQRKIKEIKESSHIASLNTTQYRATYGGVIVVVTVISGIVYCKCRAKNIEQRHAIFFK